MPARAEAVNGLARHAEVSADLFHGHVIAEELDELLDFEFAPAFPVLHWLYPSYEVENAVDEQIGEGA